MKKSFYIFSTVLVIISIAGIFIFKENAQAENLIVKPTDASKIPVKIITQEQADSNGNVCTIDLPKTITTDEGAQKQCFDYLSAVTGEMVHYMEVGKVKTNDNKYNYYCCRPETPMVVQTPLGPVVPADQAKRNESLVASTCGKGYDYPVGPQQIFPYEKIDQGLNITWPASPMRTPFTGANGIPGLIKYIYDWLISLGGMMVFITLIWAGIQYLTSAGNPTQMSGAMKRIKTASVGLALLFGSWLILNTINPILINLGVTSKFLNEGPAPDLGIKDAGGNSCGVVCEKVIFWTAENWGGKDYEIPVGKGSTITKNTGDVLGWKTNSIKVKSIQFSPNLPKENPPKMGSCSVTLYQFPEKLSTTAKPPSSIISRPIENIGADGFLMQSFEVRDLGESTYFGVTNFKK